MFLRGGAPRRPEVVAQRQQAKKTDLVIRCQCGAEVFVVRMSVARGQHATTVLLARQAHRKHQADAGCTQELA